MTAAIVGFLAVAALVLWLASLRLADASIADVFWGPGFVGVAAIAAALGQGEPARAALAVGLAALWGGRLAAYLLWRRRGKGEDPRYAAMRADHGEGWRVRSLFQVFGLQCALIGFIGLPLVAAAGTPGPALGPLDAVGAAVMLLGLAFEATGDAQLARFKADPANRGAIMDRGLWRYTRHPNYFGDAVVWWGFWLLACATPLGPWTVLSPIAMTFLLVRVSGVALLESAMAGRPGHADYVRRTSAFVPWPPRDRG